jgi:hypothetical protein
MEKAKKNPAVIPPAADPNELFLMDIPTAARRMSTTVFAVRELCRSGALVSVAIGHRWLISPGAIQRFIQKMEQEEQAA